MNIGAFIFGALAGYVLAVAKRSWTDLTGAIANAVDKASTRRKETFRAVWVIGLAVFLMWVGGTHL